jgi:hypothetical protein
MKTKRREPLPIKSGDTLQKIVEQHVGTVDCEVVAAILQIDPEALPCAAYALLHSKRHFGESAVPELCPSALGEFFELLLACGIEVGLRLAGDGPDRWKN